MNDTAANADILTKKKERKPMGKSVCEDNETAAGV